jgi:enamine deaminase RidA (YjgF/YER057c/UK114 family)
VSLERFTVPGLAAPPGYAHAVAAGGLVHTAGAVPLDADGNLVGAGDFAAQTKQVLANLTEALAAAGTTPKRVVKTVVYVVADDRAPLAEVWSVIRGTPYIDTASTLLGVRVLGFEGQLVEIEAIAAL